MIDPLNARAGDEFYPRRLYEGHTGRLVNLLVAGLVCGLLWEFWNYCGGAKWVYNVPILPDVKIFEMPILGFGGFPPSRWSVLRCTSRFDASSWRGASRPIAT